MLSVLLIYMTGAPQVLRQFTPILNALPIAEPKSRQSRRGFGEFINRAG
ncbi:hypothetical protein X771_11610 [Mesorhizobium sp. LSJC277A00]|nr:hypothetical protein X771_11610 [Mesorhizobium sp. LSJC277A00]